MIGNPAMSDILKAAATERSGESPRRPVDAPTTTSMLT